MGRERLIELINERALKRGEFVLASGRRSNFYLDGKKITLHPEGLHLVAGAMLELLAEFPGVTAVGGLTLGADPITGAVVALSHPAGRPVRGFLVRKEAKDHGTGKLVEGDLEAGEQVAIIEDTVTTGGSALKAVEAVRALGAVPVVVLGIVDREEGGREALEAAGLPLRSLATRTGLGILPQNPE